VVTDEQVGPGWANRIVGHGEEAPDQLVANPANWRTHPKGQKAALAGALDQVGWVQQVMINRRTGRMVDGHARVEIAVARHEAKVPVVYVDLSEEEEALVLATLDPLGAMAGSDSAKLAELLGDVHADDAALDRMLRDLAKSARLFTVGLDDVPEPPAVPWVQPGDLFALGDHRLLCGDSLSAEDVVRLLAGAEPTLLVTDPPYGVEYVAGAGAPGPRSKGHRNVSMAGDTISDWSPAFELVPSLQVGYVWHADTKSPEVAAGLVRLGFELVGLVIWDKQQFTLGRSWYQWRHESCWVVRRNGGRFLARRRDQATIWHAAASAGGEAVHPGTCCLHQADVWEAPSPRRSRSAVDHPTQKPIVTAQIPITNHLDKGGLVYEPFSGSGTTLMAAESLGRVCYAMEIDPRYVQVTLERWEGVTGRKAVKL